MPRGEHVLNISGPLFTGLLVVTAALLATVTSTTPLGPSTPRGSSGRLTSDQFLNRLLDYLRANRSSGHACDFDKANLCAFRKGVGGSGSWTFRQSLEEFAALMKKAAMAAADAEAGSWGQFSSSSTKDQTRSGEGSPSLRVPKADYFPCATGPVQLRQSHPTAGGPPTANLSTSASASAPLSSVLEMRLPWLQLTRLPLPLTPPEDATGGDELLPRQQRGRRWASRHQATSAGSPGFSGQQLPAMACLSVNLRFPAGGQDQDSRFSVQFGSLTQTLHNTAESSDHSELLQPTVRPPPLRRQPPSPTTGGPIGASESIAPTAASDRLPTDTWIQFTAPVHLDFSPYAEHRPHAPRLLTDAHNIPLTFHTSTPGGEETWAALLGQLSVQVNATQGVCIDNFQLVAFSSPGLDSSHCHRQLSWGDSADRSEAQPRVLLRLDHLGNPLPVADARPPASGHLNRSAVGGRPASSLLLPWVPFSGSLILALSATLLFFCLCLAISISVAFARKQRRYPPRPHHRHHRAEPRARRSRQTDLLQPQPLLPTDCAAGKHKWFQLLYTNGGDDDHHMSTLELAPSQAMPQCELTLPLNELLLVDGGAGADSSALGHWDTNRSLQLSTAGTDHQQQQHSLDETTSTDPATTSAWQFMRNLHFHRRKGGRLLRQIDAHTKAVGPPQPSLHHELPRRAPPVYRRPAMNLSAKPPEETATTNTSVPANAITEAQPASIPRRNRLRSVPVAPVTPHRQSLILSVNQHNEIVVRPPAPTGTTEGGGAGIHSGDTVDLPPCYGSGREPGACGRAGSIGEETTSNEMRTTTPSTVARSRLPSEGSDPPSYVESSAPS